MRIASLLLLAACSGAGKVAPKPTEPSTAPAPDAAPMMDRAAFNQLAVELALPVFQKDDGSVVVYRSTLPFDGDVDAAVAQIEAAFTERESVGGRRALLRRELRQGRVTLVESDLTGLPAAERTMVGHLLDAAAKVERLYQLQRGVEDMALPDDPESRAVFFRNQGPWCESPVVGTDADCHASSAPLPRAVALYEGETDQSDAFCESLPADVRQPFMVGVKRGEEWVAEPYTEHWADEMGAVAADLRAAAAAAPEGEEALAAYLTAAAQAFEDNDWFAADAAWAEMNQRNSKWYVRIGPDEVYYDPCAEHAGFHATVALVDPDGLQYQDLLDPIKQEMEAELARLAGPPYQAREVGFELPEFIQIVLNAGDSRANLGATIGQSLPNWGPVADAGGRTVAMTNMGTDPDSVASLERSVEALFCADTAAAWPKEPDALVFSTVLHEAAHNLGPSHEYRVDGKTDSEVFGGPIASMMEELKAQTAAMYLVKWLAERDLALDPGRHHMADLVWATGHIARGMEDGAGRPLPYSRLAAIQLGWLRDADAAVWHPDQTAANGEDLGCLAIDTAGVAQAIDGLAEEVFRIKAQGDKAAAEALVAQYVTDDGRHAELRSVITERLSREPMSSYVYRIDVGE